MRKNHHEFKLGERLFLRLPAVVGMILLTFLFSASHLKAISRAISLPSPGEGGRAPGQTSKLSQAAEMIPGEAFMITLSGGEARRYTVVLATGQAIHLIVDQLDIDVIVTLFGPSGSKVVEVDSPNGKTGPERLTAVADSAGEYLVEIRSFDSATEPGRCRVKLEPVGPATAQDRATMTAMQTFAEAERLRNSRSKEASREAILKYLQAIKLWHGAADPYWEAVALGNLGVTYKLIDAPTDQALGCFTGALSLWRTLNDRPNEATTLENIAEIYSGAQQGERAVEFLLKAADLWHQLADAGHEADMVSKAALAQFKSGARDRAVELFKKSLPLWESAGNLSQKAEIYGILGRAYRMMGEPAMALDNYQAALAIWREQNQTEKQARSLLAIGKCYAAMKKPAEAIKWVAQSLNLTKDSGLRGEALLETGLGHFALREYPLAFDDYSKALPLIREGKDNESLALVLFNLGLTADHLGRRRQAKDYYSEALPLIRDQGDPDFLATAANNLGGIYVQVGQPLAAIELCKEALEIWRKSGQPTDMATAYNNLGLAYKGVGDPKAALESYQQALALHKGPGELAGQAVTLANIGTAYYEQGNFNLATDHLDRALTILRQKHLDPAKEKSVLSSLGVVYDAQGEYKRALACYEEALQLPAAPADLATEGHLLSNSGAVYSSLGDKNQALNYYRRALEVMRKAEDLAGEAAVLNNLGAVYEVLGEKETALAYNKQALERRRQAADPLGEAISLNNLGQIEADMGKSQDALDHYGQALSALRALQSQVNEAMVKTNIAVLYSELGEGRKSLNYLAEALPLMQSAGSPAGQALVLNARGKVYSDIGEGGKALADYQAALALRQSIGDRRGQATVLTNIGSIYSDAGDKDKALAQFDQALKVQEELGAKADAAVTLNNRGLTYRSIGELQKALADYSRASQLAVEVQEPGLQATVLSNFGNLYAEVGDWKNAQSYYEQALPLMTKTGRIAGQATLLASIGQTLSSQGELKAALEKYQQALDLFDQAEDRAGQAGAIASIAGINQQLGEYKRALDYYQLSLRLNERINNAGGIAAALNDIGTAQEDLGDGAKALDYYTQALTKAAEIKSRRGQAIVLANIGLLYEKRGDARKALEYYHHAIELDEQVRTAARLEEFKSKFAEQTFSLYERCLLLHWKLGEKEQAFGISEHARARTFLDQVGTVRPRIHQGADRVLAAQEQTLAQQISGLERKLASDRDKPFTQLNQEVINRELSELYSKQDEYQALLVQLKGRNEEYASLRGVAPLTLLEIRSALATEATVVSYFITSEKVLAFVIRKGTFDAFELPTNEGELRQKIQAFRLFPSLFDPAPESLNDLRDRLIVPIKKYLMPGQIAVVPHGVLHDLPFAALMDEKVFPKDQYDLFYLPNASAFSVIRNKPDPIGRRTLAMAQGSAPDLKPLQNVDKEVADVAQFFGPDGESFNSHQTTETLFRRKAKDFNFIHLAAHGMVNANSPLFSRIVLGRDDQNDGNLYLGEVYQLDLSQVRLTVLSACDTGNGQRSAGDDVMALSRGFLYAGSRAVIASLWQVDDAVTTQLMGAFYRHLVAGDSAAKALREAQSEGRKTRLNPYYWAAFVLIGDPGRNSGK